MLMFYYISWILFCVSLNHLGVNCRQDVPFCLSNFSLYLLKEHGTSLEMLVVMILLCCTYSLGHVRLFVTSWAVARQAPLSMGVLQAIILEWVAMPSSRGSSWLRNWTGVSCIAEGFFTSWATREAHCDESSVPNLASKYREAFTEIEISSCRTKLES